MIPRSFRVPAFVLLAVAAAGCPKIPLPPPPRVAAGPAAEALARRDALLASVRASAVLRVRLPEGMEGAPGGKVHAVILSAARPERARLEVLTPLGTPGATILLAQEQVQVYQPMPNELMVAPFSSSEFAKRAPFPIPLRSLPALLRGTVPLAAGELREVPVLADTSAGTAAATTLEVRSNGELVERVTVERDGGYPTEDVRYENGAPALTVRYLDYGSVDTAKGPVAFPQMVTASVVRPEGTAELSVGLSDIEIDPALDADAFALTFGSGPPPRRIDLP